MESPGFWDQVEKSQEVMRELKGLKDTLQTYENLEKAYEDILAYIEIVLLEQDASMIEEIGQMLSDFKEGFEQLRIATLLSGPYDKDSAILTLHAGAGGTESCDWVSMLYRMYLRWADTRGYQVEELDYLEGEEAGIKSVTFQVSGENAYGYLKSEKAFTDWSVFRRLTQQVSGRHLSHPAMLCLILKKI